jgi:hypothetical protein
MTHLPVGLKTSAVVLVLMVAGGAVFGGLAGALGAAAGVGIVVASFTLSSLVIAWADSVHPTLVLPVGMVTYITKFTALGFVMAAVVGSGWDGLTALCLGVGVATIGWATAQAWWVYHAQIPYVDV